ncbi:unnamed protein product [Heterobilharzia americana]|nr:unnamed protein product [Heterobilharzia americana]
MVTCYLGVSSKFRVSCHSFKKLLVTPFRAARTKWIGNLSEELSKDKAGVSERKTQESNAHHCEKSTDVVACRNLLDDFINDEPVGRHTFERANEMSATFSSFADLPVPADVEIFSAELVTLSDPCVSLNPVFDTIQSLEASLLSCARPSNQFEEWLKWTIEKKMWNFPINNEQDWDSEMDVPFYEHVFLENHLDKKQLKCKPLASFLELVCNGLSKNPYFTVNEKKQHLEWFSKFFEDKISQIDASVREEEKMLNLEKVSRGNSS